jgi:hypothetical protein
MSTWSTEVSALAREIQDAEGISFIDAVRYARRELAGLEHYAESWDQVVAVEHTALTAYAHDWNEMAAAAMVAA